MDSNSTQGQSGSDGFERLWQVINRAYQPSEFRSNIRLWSAALLAAALWIVLGRVAWGQFSSSQAFAMKIATQAVSDSPAATESTARVQEKIQIYKQANEMVASSAQTIYTFLTPLVTAVTGYFFVAATPQSLKPPQGQALKKREDDA